MRESRVFHAYARRCLEAGRGESCLTLDLSECDRLDSTFLGALVDLHKRYNAGGRQRFAVAGPSEVRREILGVSRLDQLVPVCDAAPESHCEATELTADTPADPRELGAHVMECHRVLAEQGGPSSEAFARVAEQLERELSQRP
jgi:anti-anti-sigma regulatory factor